MTITELSPALKGISPEYGLTEREREELLHGLTAEFSPLLKNDETNVIIADSFTPLANYVRSIEAEKLPTIPAVMERYEDSSKFMIVLQDYEQGVTHDKAAHAFRIHRITDAQDVSTPVGLPTFDDVLKMGLASEEQLVNYYEASSLKELGKAYISVESNIAVDGVKPSMRKPYSALGYRAIFELVAHEDVRGVVAYQNPEAMKSIARLGLISHPLLGNPELAIIDEDKEAMGRTDMEKYYPLTIESIPRSYLTDGSPESNHRVFTDPEYAQSVSRIAGLVASRSLNVINLV